jgi:GNAT superfamily N-acetyltransferase
VSRLLRANADQKQDRDQLAWGVWGARLKVQEFHRRERALRAHPWAVSGMDTWLWVDDQGAVLSSCESFTCSSFFHGERARSYAVASVLTEEKLRGRGYARGMMDALVGEIRRGDPSAHAVVLYSDVGEALYGRSGFVGLPAWDAELEPCEGDPAEGVDELLPEEVPELPPPPAEEAFLIWPDAHQIDWHRARERFYAEVLARPRSVCCGARVGSSQAYWAADIKNERLLVLLVTEPVAGAAAGRGAAGGAPAPALAGLALGGRRAGAAAGGARRGGAPGEGRGGADDPAAPGGAAPGAVEAPAEGALGVGLRGCRRCRAPG